MVVTLGQRYNVREKPTVILYTYIPSANPFKCHEEVLSLQPMIPPKRFDIFPPDWEMLRRSRRVSSDFSSKNAGLDKRLIGTVRYGLV